MSSGSSQKTKQTSTVAPTAQAGQLYSDVIKGSQTAANNLQYDPATGKTIADFTPDQLAAFQGVQGAQGTGKAATDSREPDHARRVVCNGRPDRELSEPVPTTGH